MNTKEKTLNLFKERVNSGKSIRYNDLQKEDHALLYAITRHYGGILNISKELGIDEDTLVKKYGLSRNINPRTLTEEEIENRLLYLKSIGKLSTSAMRTEFDDLRLEQSIKKVYGSVERGLKYFNLERDTVKVTEKNLLKEIKEHVKKGDDLSYKNAISINSKLVFNATKKFNMGWHSLLDSLDIDYASKHKSLNRENITHRINNIIEKEGTINYQLMRKYDGSLLYHASENYDSIIDFYIDYGIDPNEALDFSKQTVKGFELEKVYGKLLDTLRIDYIYNKSIEGNTSLRPDFQLSKGTLIDCKLSAWTSSIEDTIEKYSPHCEKIIIVFLRGEYHHLPKIENTKVEFKKIDEYYPYLRQINRHDLIEEFENILNNDEFLVSVTTERLTP